MKVMVALSYLFIVSGSIGMILFATRFPLSSRIIDLKYLKETLFGLKGHHVWFLSWILIIAGTLIQFSDFLLRYCQ